jgi:TolA-binding protein
MKPTLLSLRFALGASILGVAASSQALTLGRSQGVPLIGRPLDVAVQLALDPGTDSTGICSETDVFYADNRVEPGRVTSRFEAANGTTASLRIRSQVPVDEPFVTLVVRVGCTQKITRRYVLLAEQPPELPAGAIPQPTPEPAIPLPGQTAMPRAGAAAVPGAASPAQRSRPSAERSAPRAVRIPAATPARAPAQARLKLEPLDLSFERDPTLKSTAMMSGAPEATSQRRAEAAALWQALNAQPEDILRTAQRMQALEGDIKSLRDGVLKNNASLSELRAQLEQAQSQRYSNALVYGLMALLLAAVLVAAWIWSRRRSAIASGRDWWRGGAAPDSGFGAEFAPSSRSQKLGPASKSPVDLDLSFTESVIDHLRASPQSRAPQMDATRPLRADTMDFSASHVEGLRSVKAEELHDIQQQADFFVSLGEYDQAIEVLRSHINAHPETSVVAWLDLLEIYHKLARREDYESTREEFHSVFNAQVPPFEAYPERTEGLESYRSAMSRIVALWPSPKVLEVIEESIFRKPGDLGGEAFGLEAYRELLLLHNIGKEVIDSGDSLADFGPSSGSQGSGFSHTSIQPLSAKTPALAAYRDDDATMVDFPRIGLDINLDEPAALVAGQVDLEPWAPSNLVDFDLPDVESPPEPTLPRS